LTLSCKNGFDFNKKSKDPVIAKVGDKKLFKSQLEMLVNAGSSATDSAAIVDGFIENWVRENLMIAEAEKNVAADINLNKLVDDYRSSLLVYNFEKRLIDQRLDTAIALSDKKAYYENNKNQYLLSHPIVQCIIAKIPEKDKGLSSVKSALNKSDLTEAFFLVKEKAVYHHIDAEKWLSIEEIKSLVPEGTLSTGDLKQGKLFQKHEGQFEFFVKILGYYDEKEIPPFEYIESKITKSIFSERKNKILRDFRNELYEKGLNDGRFEMYNKT
jgi:hypothetical protein